MGNYHQLEIDFVKRTLALIDQYEGFKDCFPFDEQYNHTLLVNCLLGLIVLPKEKIFSYVPKTRIALIKTLKDSGIHRSIFNPAIKDTCELFGRLRNAVAHFDIEFVSETPENLIDKIIFRDVEADILVATFYSDEFLKFIKFYAATLLKNMDEHL